MNKEKLLKILGIFFIVLTVANFLLFIFGKINIVEFWFIIILCALVAFFGIPRIKEHL